MSEDKHNKQVIYRQYYESMNHKWNLYDKHNMDRKLIRIMTNTE